MWTVVYVSQSLETAKKLADTLLENSIISKLRQVKNSCKSDGCCYEVLVPNTELEATQDVIFENELF